MFLKLCSVRQHATQTCCQSAKVIPTDLNSQVEHYIFHYDTSLDLFRGNGGDSGRSSPTISRLLVQSLLHLPSVVWDSARGLGGRTLDKVLYK